MRVFVLATAALALTACGKSEPSVGPAAAPAAESGTPAAALAQTDIYAPLEELIEFKADKPGVKYMVSGWLPYNEVWGTWTANTTEPGVIALPVDPKNVPAAIEIEYWGCLSEKFPYEEFKFTMAGDPTIVLKSELAQPIVVQTIKLGEGARKAAAETGVIRFEVLAPDGKSPKSIGINPDERVLGFGIRQLRIKSQV